MDETFKEFSIDELDMLEKVFVENKESIGRP